MVVVDAVMQCRVCHFPRSCDKSNIDDGLWIGVATFSDASESIAIFAESVRSGRLTVALAHKAFEAAQAQQFGIKAFLTEVTQASTRWASRLGKPLPAGCELMQVACRR